MSDIPVSAPHLAIALGDPAGIGTEVVLKALRDPAFSTPVTLVGNKTLLDQACVAQGTSASLS
jgi:4-hydroxythreonine-4-phosphate dehydrogenase